MSARQKMLAATLGIVVAATACSGIADDSTTGSTLAPLDVAGAPPSEAPNTAPAPASPTTPTTVIATTTASTTSSSTLPPTTFTTTTTSTVPDSTSTTEAPATGGRSGVQATIGGRSIGAAEACLDGRNVTLNGVTWSFAGNSFRLAGGGDGRSEAELVGDGWTMPMLVGSVSGGVYTYVGSPVDGSVSSAQVIIDFNELDSC